MAGAIMDRSVYWGPRDMDVISYSRKPCTGKPGTLHTAGQGQVTFRAVAVNIQQVAPVQQCTTKARAVTGPSCVVYM